MYKVASLARFAQSLSKQEAGGYWTAAHAPLMKLVSPLAGYVQSHVTGPLPLAAGVAERETFFDGYSCAWWESLSDFQHAVTTSAWQDVIDDGARIFDMDWLWNMSAHLEENVVVHGPRAPYKVVWVIRFKHGMTRSEGRDYWANVHGPIVEQLNVARYVQNHVVGPIGADGDVAGAEIGFDGFSECWLEDEQQLLDLVGSPAWAAAVEDSTNVFDVSRIRGAVLSERVIVDPTRAVAATSPARRRRPGASRR